MNKKTIMYIVCTVALVIVIALVLCFTMFNKNTNNTNADQNKINIVVYDENFDISKTIEITNKKQMKEIEKICVNPSLEQDDVTPNLAIKNDVKLDLGAGRFYMIQLSLPEYCYYEDANTDTKLVIKMPEGLLDKVNQLISK